MGTRFAIALVVACACGSPGANGDDDDPGPDAEIPTPGMPGPPGCGLDAAAFCDPFDGAKVGGRARELDGALWSGARAAANGPSSDGNAMPIGRATLPPCRVGLPSVVMPGQDVLICDTISTIQSNHLLVAAAAQNYGQSSMRIRRPFDFAARTGTIVFDATLVPGGLQGWTAIAITKEPTAAPSYTKVQNEENGALPRNAIEIHFNQNCQTTGQVSVGRFVVYDDYVQTIHEVENEDRHCVSMAPSALNHVEVKVSSQRIEVYASPVSDDGVTFAPVELLAAVDVALPFTKGYVHLSTHNHASLKYSDDTVDAWITRWDNVGFDGPVVEGWREAEVADSLTSATEGRENIGWRLGTLAMTGWSAPLSFSTIDMSNAASAQIALTTFMHLDWGTPADFQLDYRINGGAPHARKLDASQMAMLAALPVSGTMSMLIDVDPAELHDGTNTIELATTNVPLAYPPVVYNLDLIVQTN
ncbi:MAG: hypothetical protein AB7T06_13110 [Kofleriaceae bacterium]